MLSDITKLIVSSGLTERLSGKERISGLFGTARSAYYAAMLSLTKQSHVIVSRNPDQAEHIAAEIKLFDPEKGKSVFYLDPDDPSSRITAIWAAREKAGTVIVASAEALKKRTFSKDSVKGSMIRIEEGRAFYLDELGASLMKLGYQRVPMVEDQGDFSVRGGIVDIFSVDETPVRIEFEGDIVSSIRKFDPSTQRSIEFKRSYTVMPLSEKEEGSFLELFKDRPVVVIDEPSSFGGIPEELKGRADLSFDTVPASAEDPVVDCSLADKFASNIELLTSYLRSDCGTVFLYTKQDQRLKEIFVESAVDLSRVRLVHGELWQGFILPKEKISLLTDSEIFGEHVPRRRFKVKKTDARQEQRIEFSPGDHVVHKDYGIGIFKGVVKQSVDGIEQDYIFLKYAGDDSLYMPVDQIGLLSKYSSPGESGARINRLSSPEWIKTKTKVKKSIKDMTKELTEIYSSRKMKEGFAFPPDSLWQEEFEQAFPYEETPDQIKAIQEVKADMEDKKAMDRLVCGDVGYGKTEVALRAAFKAVSSGKQAAFLVPTTILAEQHYLNLKERFSAFPFKVEMMSRFRTKEEQAKVAKGVSEGAVDVVVGTHRLLQKDVNFKDLGLLVIDEEQKFGVSHKEKLKKLKRNVDVLTMSATPIPRTLHLALSGIWDMSQITTPPPGRSQISTAVLPWEENTVIQAVLRETNRGGQVFYVHNRVETIGKIAEKLKKMFPLLRIAVGHGQMRENELEKVMTAFIDGQTDILVCTTIIESGLDIPNVNTIIIDSPENFGLSSLYQLRGRVGRSDVKAYAYLLYHPGRMMTGRSLERLTAIKSFTALGSGYKIAMRDLEIRGAGNVLGAQQSGHMMEVGFDLYCELLEESAAELRGEPVRKKTVTVLDIPVTAYIPENYINDELERISLYKRINLADSEKELELLKDEMKDRFGKVPLQIENLFAVTKIRLAASEKGYTRIHGKKDFIVLEKGGRKTRIDTWGYEEKDLLKELPALLK